MGKTVRNVLGAIGAYQSTKALFTLTSQVEQSKIAFETLLGSQEKALQMMKDIDTFAANTPFEKTNLTPLVQQLIGMGFEANKALPIINVLGDSMAALGRGQDDLNGVVLALGQIQTKGKVSAEELMQMAERGLPVFQILEQKLGLTKKQLENIGNAGISSATGINALLTGLNEKFGGAMAKQAQTLAGQWSNLMDNVKSLVGNAGQEINNKVKGWIASVNNFFDKNRPVIQKFVQDMLFMITSVGESIAVVFGVVWDVISQVMAGITGQTNTSAKSQMKAWQAVFMVVANGVNGMALLISYAIRGVFAAAKIVSAALKTVADTVVGGVMMIVAGSMMPIQNMINAVIKGINLIRSVMGKTAYDGVTFASDLGQKAATFIKDSWTGAGEDIGNAWKEASDGMASDTQRIVGNMVENMERYQGTVKETAGTTSDLGARIKGSLDGMAGSLKGLSGAQGDAKKSAAEHNKELKAMKDKAEDAIKPILDKIKENKKEIDETRKKIKETSDEWKKYKEEGVRALADVNAQIVKLKQEAGNINVKVNSDQTNKLAERYVEILKEQKSAQDEIDKARISDQGKDTYTDTSEAQNRLVALAKERQLIENGVNKSVLDSAIAYDGMSQSEKIILDMQKERNTQLTENGSKMQAALEKQQILEAQIQQKKIGQVTVFSEYKDGLLTASIELEKGKRVEIHDQENIALAAEIALKQDTYRKDYEGLVTTLQSKLAAQQANLQQTATLYKQFNTFLKDDTKKTSEEMIKMIQAVNEQLRQMIALKAQAGL